MATLFGWQFKRNEHEDTKIESFVQKDHDDGALVVAGGSYGTYVDLDGSIRTEAELVSKYREMALHPEVDNAIDEVVNDSISTDDDYIVKILLDDLPYNDVIKKAIEESFDEVLDMLNFNNQAYEIYRRFYVDGRLYYHAVIDENDPTAGIKEIRYIDPRKIRKIREVLKRPARGQINVAVENGAIDKLMNEYYIFNDKGFNIKGNTNNGPGVAQGTTGLKIAPDAIIQVTSGLTNTDGTLVLSYLQKAIRPLTQLRTMEDSLIVYRLARAPERRVWYIDVGNLPKAKAEQYVRDIMTKHKNRLVYDSETGAISDTRKYMSMLDDYWLPRRADSKGTEVTTLAGGQNLSQMDDVVYFQKYLYSCLNVPVTRLNPDALFSIGRATEISRDEVKFAKFISRLRSKFSMLFTRALGKHLILKQIMSLQEWDAIERKIKYDFAKDSHFTEMKDFEVLAARLDAVQAIQPFVGVYFSHEEVRKNILKQTNDDIEEIDAQIAFESENPQYNPPTFMGDDGQMVNVDPNLQGLGNEEGVNKTKEDNQNRLLNAQNKYDTLKKKQNRSPQQQSEFHKVTQILSKNGKFKAPSPEKSDIHREHKADKKN
jgi:hypothetical protein